MIAKPEVLRHRPSDRQEQAFAAICADRAVKVAMTSALRTRSFSYRHWFARLASRGQLSYEEIRQGHEPTAWEPEWLVALGQTMCFQELEPDDRRVGTQFMERGLALLAPPDQQLEQLAQLLIHAGRWSDAWRLVNDSPSLVEKEHGYLLTDLLNPFDGSPYGNLDAWYARFTNIFTSAGYIAPALADGHDHAFDRLRSGSAGHSEPRAEDGPLVSVVMTTFKTNPNELRTSVRSILEQTWTNLEVLLVDDCSPDEFVPGLEEIAEIDPRVRLVRLEENGGTYLARNAGMRLARGEFVTGQDADDWSHPERIAEQIRPLLADRSLPGTRCLALTTNDQLTATRPGYSATRPNPSSLMFPRELGLAVGGFLPSRKGADSEFHARLDAISSKPVATIGTSPLSIVRIRTDSLSRSDFRAGWTHTTRRTFIDCYRRWHELTPSTRLISIEGDGAQVAVPWAFAIHRTPPQHFDVVWVADFRPRSLRSSSRADEVRALVDAGLQVAVLQIEDPRFQTARKDAFEPELLDLINAGRLTRIAEDEPHTASLVVIRQTAPLAAPPAVPMALKVNRLAVVADRLAWDPHDGLEELAHEGAIAEALFGTAPIWVAPTRAARDAIERTLPSSRVSRALLPETVDPEKWRVERPGPRREVPVVGRAGTDARSTWSPDSAELCSISPRALDVRVLGGISAIREELDSAPHELPWMRFTHEDIDTRTFLSSIDFLVYLPREHLPILMASPVVEALASGCIVALPAELAENFGEAVVVAEPATISSLLHELHSDAARYANQVQRSIAFAAQNNSNLATILVRELMSVGSP